MFSKISFQNLGLFIIVLFCFSACKQVAEECPSCCNVPPQHLTFTNPETGKVYDFQFFNAITPLNENYCDYEVIKYIPIKIVESCRPNPDSSFNDDLNIVFVINGYNPREIFVDGYRTFMLILLEDSIPIWQSLDAQSLDARFSNITQVRKGLEYGADGWFNGSIDNYTSNSFEKIQLPNGRYHYQFYVYDTLKVEIADSDDPFANLTADSIKRLEYLYPDLYSELLEQKFNAMNVEYLVDSVVGTFCIIRNEEVCNVSGCEGADSGDPLLSL